MKKVVSWLWKIICGRAFCMATLVIAIMLPLAVIVSVNIFTETVSFFGENNPLWFLSWGLFTCFSFLVNMHMLCKKLHINNKLLSIMIVIACVSAIVTSLVYGSQTPVHSTVHWLASTTFGTLGFFSVLIVYLISVKTRRKYVGLLIVLCVTAILDLICYFTFGMTAITELLILVVTQVCILISNFMLKSDAKLEKEPSQEEGIQFLTEMIMAAAITEEKKATEEVDI